MSAIQILVVEDDKSIQFFLRQLLQKEGYTVTIAPNGHKALAEIANTEFALAILDLNLGESIGGMDVLKVIRQRWPETIVILLTGQATLETAVTALRQGAHDYLFKPCPADQLRDSIRRGLQKRDQERRQQTILNQLEEQLTTLQELRTHRPTPPVIPTPAIPTTPPPAETPSLPTQIDIDAERHSIRIVGRPLDLTPIEFNTFAYLIKAYPRVVSPQEMMQAVQGYEGELWEARDLVRVHIYRIRQKIKKVTKRTDIIQTVHGVGYTLKEE